MKKYWLLIFLIILIARVFISSLSYNRDLNNNLNWTDSIRNLGFSNFYERDFYPFSAANYPPLITTTYYYFDIASKAVFGDNYSARTTFNKLPTILVESFTMSLTILVSPVIFIVYLINPGIFYNSVLWGQTEGLVAALILMCLYVLTRTKRPVYSALIFLFALLVKQSAIIFLPLYLYLAFRKFKLSKTIYITLGGFVLYTFFFIPYYGSAFIQKSISFLLNSSQGQSHFASVNALNFWYMLGLNKVSDSLGGIISYQNMGLIISAFFILLIIYILRKRINFDNTLVAAGLINFAVCMFLTRVHERHLLPTLVLLIPIAIKSKLNFAIYFVISGIYFLNLYLIWHEMFANFDHSTLVTLSLMLAASFVYFLYQFFQSKKTPEES